jgi:alkylhydroperoxidase family enzyme
MAWIKTVPVAEATGLLGRLYDEAMRRAGKVFNIIRIQSPRPRVLRNSTMLYHEVMFAEENGLTRAQRELIATVVSRANDCHY